MEYGATVLDDGRVRFRLWAPAARSVDLCLERPGGDAAEETVLLPMESGADGWFTLTTDRAGSGSRYRFRIDADMQVPDPASRFQPDDVHGASVVVDPSAYSWRDADWRGRPWEDAVIYELHVGTFTPEGTFEGVQGKLDYLAGLGVTALELMPLADFPGARNWGYDGTCQFAPDSRYGTPDELKALVDAAHARGLMVYLDVVYNHFGPEGNYLYVSAPAFFTDRHHTPWGAAINLDGDESRPVREFFIENALYWLEEFHFDGLRMDAVHAFFDHSEPHFLTELASRVRTHFGAHRHIHLVLENDDNAARYLAMEAADRARRYDAQWNDDIHHALHVSLTGETGGYYGDYAQAPVHDLAQCLTEGFAYQGEPSAHRGDIPRGEPSAQLPATAFVAFLQNHDQIGNRAFGERIGTLCEPEALHAATALLLLAPAPPLLFMGQEWSCSQPFQFFCDFGPDLAGKVAEGRRSEFAKFPEYSDPQALGRIPDPSDRSTFERCVLDWTALDTPQNKHWLDLHRRLLALRHRELTPRLSNLAGGNAEYELLGKTGFRAHWVLGDGSALSLTANLSAESLAATGLSTDPILYTTHERLPEASGQTTLPPWSVTWRLRSAGEAR